MQFELTSGKRLNLISQWAPQEDLQSWDQWGFTWRSHKCLLSWKLHLSCLDTVRDSHGRHRTQGIQAEWAKFVAELKITSPFFFQLCTPKSRSHPRCCFGWRFRFSDVVWEKMLCDEVSAASLNQFSVTVERTTSWIFEMLAEHIKAGSCGSSKSPL